MPDESGCDPGRARAESCGIMPDSVPSARAQMVIQPIYLLSLLILIGMNRSRYLMTQTLRTRWTLDGVLDTEMLPDRYGSLHREPDAEDPRRSNTLRPRVS